MSRDLHVSSIIVGRKGTGKSTKLANIARAYPKTLKVLVIDVNGSAAYNSFKEIQVADIKRLRSGIVKLVGTPTDETLAIIARDFRGGLAIFEDCTKYIYGNVNPAVKSFLVDHRMCQCDLIFTFHSMKRIPPFFWEMISYITILKTQELFETSRNKNLIPNYEDILKAYKQVQSNPDQYYSQTVQTLI